GGPGQLPNLIGTRETHFASQWTLFDKLDVGYRPGPAQGSPAVIAIRHSWHEFEAHRFGGMNIIFQGNGIFGCGLDEVQNAIRPSAEIKRLNYRGFTIVN